MTFSDVPAQDLVVFIALAKALVRADRTLSAAEAGHLRALADEIGPARFDAALAESRAKIIGADAAFEAAKKVGDPGVRAFLHERLRALAASDEIVAAEASVLSRIAEIWLESEDAPRPLRLG